MADIVLTTVNAKYIHTAFGLRYLKANLGPLRERAAIVEFTDREKPADMLEQILAHDPRIVGVGVYVWNALLARDLVALLKRVRPDVVVVVGGPEVSHEVEAQEITALCDHVITGEGDLAFADLCARVLAGERPGERVIAGGAPDLGGVVLPYDLYDDVDVRQRVIYVEASRGCPYRCQFCLSALDTGVRTVDLERLIPALEDLLARGVRHFKFVDRTFNLRIEHSRRLLELFLARWEPGLFVHFEVIPDRFPPALREVVERFPPGALQFEVGIQTFDPEVARRIERRQDAAAVRANLEWMRAATGVHVHADLIVGLPGEGASGFADGFDTLVGLRPQEIQVGILKRLRGAPIAAHDGVLVYSDRPPYEVLRTDVLDFATLQRLKRFAKLWDTVANSGNFKESAPLLWGDGSPFAGFLAFCDWLFARLGRVHSLALDRLVLALRDYLISVAGLPAERVEATLRSDYCRGGRTRLPAGLRAPEPPRARRPGPPARQARHVAP